ncbi:hypothetical protein [Synechococcus sp. MIT S1220]|uniref:hypothetical protein n=1 Tax=Synechococcus sp. MIT S1220 TaxID=3082549 RepID=UPI0039B0F823
MADAVLVRTIQTRLQKIVFRPSVCWILACLPCLALTGCSQAINPMGIRPVITVYVGIPGFAKDDAQNEQFDVSKEIILQKVPRWLENADVRLSALPESKLADLVEERNQYGLGPDLIVSSELTARKMRARKMLKPFEIKKPLPWSERYKIVAGILSVKQNTYYSLPVFIESQYACGNKTLIQSMPASFAELPSAELKAPFQAVLMRWSEFSYFGSAFGEINQEELKMIFADDYSFDEKIIPNFIEFARNARGEENELLTPEESVKWRVKPSKKYYDRGFGNQRLKDFENGLIGWMPCRNSSIERLDRTMGSDLMVSLLPGVKEGVPAIGNPNVMVVSMGRQSSRGQQKYAFEWINQLIDSSFWLRNNGKFSELSKYLDLEQFELHERAELELFRDIEAILDASSHGNILPSTLLRDDRVNMEYHEFFSDFFASQPKTDEEVIRKYVSLLRSRLSKLPARMDAEVEHQLDPEHVLQDDSGE